MKIAFDAKRAYQNNTGLGHYSRTLITSLANTFPQHEYYLCAPKVTGKFDIAAFSNVHNITPQTYAAKKLPSLWRSSWVKNDLLKNQVDVYHGLSHEIPFGIDKKEIKSVVTIHDLIFERYPKQYSWIDVQIYRKKFTYACHHANKIIAISNQTKEDIINFYGIDEAKIEVCYQSCDPCFSKQVSNHEKQRIRQKYNLPENFFLYVGSIIERKNLLSICKALNQIKDQLKVPLVVIGDGGHYKQLVENYVAENYLQHLIIFLSETPAAQNASYKNATDFPAIYQQALCLIYPSIFEGFGIPVLEALWSRTPVITSNISCMPETGGDAAYYVNPYQPDEIAEGLLKIATDPDLAETMKQKGWEHAQKFIPEICADKVMQVYLRLV